MYELDKKYIDELETLASEIQESEELAKYLEEEEEEDYSRLKETFEPRIGLLYDKVAADNPLQLIPLELLLLENYFEGLYLPRILGYSVLRGEVDANFKYVRPQEHFKEILLTICQSSNFDILKKRIGQSIQVGFALSSDIWVTNLINSVENKRIRYYLQGQKLDRYRRAKERQLGLERYMRQFKNDNFQTAEFPDSPGSLKVLYSSLKNFLLYRYRIKGNNKSIIPPLKNFLEQEEYHGVKEHLHLMMIYGMFFELTDLQLGDLASLFNDIREEMPDFTTQYLEFILDLYQIEKVELTPDADLRISMVIDRDLEDELSSYYNIVDTIHNKGFNQEEVQEAVKRFYHQYEGGSLINECVREIIFQYFKRYLKNLEPTAYNDFFEITKLYPIYMGIFTNQKFNQGLKDLSMSYVKKLLKVYTDKRGKDYQDMKKFVSRTFKDFQFLKDKEIVELFKTKRKKKPATEASNK